jgi:hypothetical protein
VKKLFIIVSIVFLFLACDPEPMESNPFIGTWEFSLDTDSNFVFTNSIATCYHYNKGFSNDIYWTGIYTYDDVMLTINLDTIVSAEEMITGYPNGLIYTYEFIDDILILSNPAPWTFKKIK